MTGTRPAAAEGGRSPDPARSCPAEGRRAMPLHGPRMQQAPAGLYQEMREQFGGIAPVELDGGVPAWLVLGYHEIQQVAANGELFARDPRLWSGWETVPEDWGLMSYVGRVRSVGLLEGAEHRRRARVLGEAMDQVDRFELQRLCEQVADRLIDEFAATGSADLIAQYTHRLPMRVIAEVLGVPPADIPDLERDLGLLLEMTEESYAALERFVARIRQLARDRIAEPRDDVAGRMGAHEEGLNEQELADDLSTVLGTAPPTTGHWIGNALRLMLTDPDFAASLGEGRRSTTKVLGEVLWEDTPTQNYIGRFATRDTELGGFRISTGDMLILGLAAGNSDPAVRPNSTADAVGNSAFLSFGTSDRGCPQPAPELAEIIARTGIEVLLDRLPDLELAVRPDELVWEQSMYLRGLTALPVRFNPSYLVGA